MYILEIDCTYVMRMLHMHMLHVNQIKYIKKIKYIFFPKLLSTFFEKHRIFFNNQIYNYSYVIC